MLQGVEFICWNCIFSITSFQFPEVSHNFCMYFPKVLQSLTKSPKCNFPIELHMSRLQTTESVTTAGADWTRLTVNHHVDEKYGKLALDSIKKLGRENETKASYCFLIYSRGGRAMALRQRLTELQLKMEQCRGDIWKGWHWEWKVRDSQWGIIMFLCKVSQSCAVCFFEQKILKVCNVRKFTAEPRHRITLCPHTSYK